ncbi:hypothetical protein C8R41DRAFT_927319 [Lentinula lateritia]|uniref:Uncharacterized protein n=1 Tax=Lentinula lateritia TaxID=40482 RepID=A0ABQ8UW63_9AGAR|nr:hypothetical protein C8R41DRAFT_927319 [Lentinula lateritia]
MEFSLLSVSLSLFLSILVYGFDDRLHDLIYAFTSRLSNPKLTSPTPPRAPPLLPKLRDLDLGNIEAASYIELRTASPLQPPTLEDVHPRSQSPGTYPPGHISSQELRPSIRNSNTTYLILCGRSSKYNSYHAILLGSVHPSSLPTP